MCNKKNRKGFSLSELLVVVIVIAVLGAMATPMFSKAIKRSRASDALKVLSLASDKQEVFLINNDRPAISFDELSAPVKGLKGDENVKVRVGHFHYSIDAACVSATRPEDGYTIYRNFDTQEVSCDGPGCTLLVSMIPTSGFSGCQMVTSHGIGEGSGPGDPCANGACAGKTPQTCPAGATWNAQTGSRVSNQNCPYGYNPDGTCAQLVTNCPGGQIPNGMGGCECPAATPYFYDNACHAQRPGTDDKGCAPGQCHDGAQCITSNLPPGQSAVQQEACSAGGQRQRTFGNGCPGAWGPWGDCICPQNTKPAQKTRSCTNAAGCSGTEYQNAPSCNPNTGAWSESSSYSSCDASGKSQNQSTSISCTSLGKGYTGGTAYRSCTAQCGGNSARDCSSWDESSCESKCEINDAPWVKVDSMGTNTCGATPTKGCVQYTQCGSWGAPQCPYQTIPTTISETCGFKDGSGLTKIARCGWGQSENWTEVKKDDCERVDISMDPYKDVPLNGAVVDDVSSLSAESVSSYCLAGAGVVWAVPKALGYPYHACWGSQWEWRDTSDDKCIYTCFNRYPVAATKYVCDPLQYYKRTCS